MQGWTRGWYVLINFRKGKPLNPEPSLTKRVVLSVRLADDKSSIILPVTNLLRELDEVR